MTLNILTDNGCPGTVTIPVTVHPNPVVDFAATEVCDGFATDFTDQTTIGSGTITSWSWDFGDLNTDNVQNPTHTYNGWGTYNVTLTTTSDQGCTESTTLPVVVNEGPTANFTTSVPSACSPMEVLFSDSSVSSTGAINDWLWNFGDNTFNDGANPLHSYEEPGLYTVELTVTDNSGCSSSVMHDVEVEPFQTFHIPNAFSPNGDGRNDFIRPVIFGAIEPLSFEVFSRWGELLFVSAGDPLSLIHI